MEVVVGVTLFVGFVTLWFYLSGEDDDEGGSE